MTKRTNPYAVRHAEDLYDEAARLAAVRERNAKPFKAIKNPTEKQKRDALALDKPLAKKQAQLEADAMAIDAEGLTPQQAARRIREHKIAAKKRQENRK